MIVDPPHLVIAKTYLGLHEIVGAKNSPIIMSKIAKLGVGVLGAVINDDEAPWCGTFMAWVMQECGVQPPKIAVRASSWDKFGQYCGVTYGAVLRFQRPGGGHVGIATAKRINKDGKVEYKVIGGNQSNSVCETWIERDRLITSRWPSEFLVTYQTLPIVSNNIAPTSRNEK